MCPRFSGCRWCDLWGERLGAMEQELGVSLQRPGSRHWKMLEDAVQSGNPQRCKEFLRDFLHMDQA